MILSQLRIWAHATTYAALLLDEIELTSSQLGPAFLRNGCSLLIVGNSMVCVVALLPSRQVAYSAAWYRHSCLLCSLAIPGKGERSQWKAARKSLISNNQHYPWSGPAMPASAVIGEEFAGFGIRLGVFGQAGGIFSHSLSSHPEEFQVNRDWPVFWSAPRNLSVWNCVKWRSWNISKVYGWELRIPDLGNKFDNSIQH